MIKKSPHIYNIGNLFPCMMWYITTLCPTSTGQFLNDVDGVMRAILGVLSAQGSPLMINAYPYFAYASDPENIALDHAMFRANGTVKKYRSKVKSMDQISYML